MPSRRERNKVKTRLAMFVRSRGFVMDELEDVSGVTRQHILKAMNGAGIRQATMKRLVRACRVLSGENVIASQLFALGDDVEAPHAPAPDLWPSPFRRTPRPRKVGRRVHSQDGGAAKKDAS
jgi:hypothetical protein